MQEAFIENREEGGHKPMALQNVKGELFLFDTISFKTQKLIYLTVSAYIHIFLMFISSNL